MRSKPFNKLAHGLLLIFTIGLMASCTDSGNLLESKTFSLRLNETGRLTELLDKNSGKNLLMSGESISFLTVESGGENHMISKWKRSGNVLIFRFDGIDADIKVKVENKKEYLTFEIIDLNSTERIDKVIWGPYQVIPSEKIGQSIGIAYDDEVAIGFMGLNLKSRGGFEKLHRGRFGNAAQRIEGGASLSGFVRDRSYLRVVDNWEQKLGQAVPVNDSDAEIAGAKFAMYCTAADQLIGLMEKIVLQEKLPHIKNGDTWNKISKYSTSSKFIMSYNVKNIDDCIALAKKAGISCVYHGGIFKTWGTFELHPRYFPNGYQSVRECSEKAEQQGINLGAHTLTNFITTNDPLVSPKPHSGLVKAGITQLKQGISDADTEIILLDESMRAAYHEPNLHKVNPRWRKHTVVRIGDEIIEYTVATAEGQLILKDCNRGAFGTEAVAHEKGAEVARLMSHGYKVFFPDIQLQDEMAKNLAKFFNEAQLKRISFDGIEGGLACGHGSYGSDRFVKVFYDHLNNPNIVANSSDVTHWGWHYFSNESWGEPWTSSNFREAHLDHRIKVQKGLKEDLLPTKMGQFSINKRTTKKDIEWVMGLCAGYDAGVDFYISPNFEAINEEAAAILAEIKRWETARMNDLFTAEQKEKLRDPYTFYALEEAENGVRLVFIESWAPEGGKAAGIDDSNTLPSEILKNSTDAPVSFDYKHVNMTTEPGMPTSSSWEYYCAGEKQKLHYAIRLPKEAKENIKGIYLKVGTQKCELPLTLKPGEYLLNKGNTTILHCDEKHTVLKKIALDDAALTVSEGKNLIEFDYKGKGRVAGPEMLVNFQTKK